MTKPPDQADITTLGERRSRISTNSRTRPTHVIDPDSVSDIIRERHIVESFISRLPGARRHYQKYLGFMPRALEEFDLSSYDLVISSESGPAKGVLAPPGAGHICYCHSPMRYIYDHYGLYREQLGLAQRIYFSHLAHRLRQWDAISALRVDRFVANSSFVAQRIRRVYGREADVVHPPVDIETYHPEPAPTQDYFLCVSELVGYKRVDLAIDAFRESPHRLIIAGAGEQLRKLREHAPPNVEFLGRVSEESLHRLYANARALIFPGEEDFGIVPVEAMACGTPVIAYGRGGARDTVVDGVTGLLFESQDPEAVRGALARFDGATFDRSAISKHARRFSADRFRNEFLASVNRMIAGRR